jgi:hypothetical protein
MLNFKKRETVVALEADIEGMSVVCAENRKWDRKTRKFLKETDWRVSVEMTDNVNHNCIDVVVSSEEEAKVVAQQAVNFLQSIRPVLLFKKYEDSTEE